MNGCGCEKGILRFFKPPYSKLFNNACNVHDEAYANGGDKIDRLSADRMLFRNIVAISYYSFISPYRMAWMVIMALIYYIAVRIFGKNYFNYK